VIYCAGLGEVTPALPPGVAATGPTPTANPVQVSIGGKQVQRSYAGLATGTPGVYQVIAAVPPDAVAGDRVPVAIKVAGQTSPVVTMAIR
jgi:uncharacterized protein (TIGR03437 family)